MNNNRYYIWSTIDIEKRISDHHNWHTKTTKNKEPKLIFSKSFETLKEARYWESFIKKMKSRIVIEKIISGNRERKK